MPENATAAAAKKMLLVLPFENLGGDSEQECFADGLTEEMISQLGQLNPKRLGVIARTSAIQYKATKKSIREIAAELHIENLANRGHKLPTIDGFGPAASIQLAGNAHAAAIAPDAPI